MADRVPSFLLLVPGPWETPEALVEALVEQGVSATVAGTKPFEAGSVEVDIVSSPQLGDEVVHSWAGAPPDDLRDALEASARAALVEIGRRLDEERPALATLGRALRDLGGLAVRMERSGHAMDWDTFLGRVEDDNPLGLLALGVIFGRDEDGHLFTCGMHHFDCPEAQVAMDDVAEAARWLESICLFQLTESPSLGTGHTFRPNREVARRKLERWPDHRHGTSDGRHNPFGVWRILDEDAPGLEALEVIPTFMPALYVLLDATERRLERPLRREELEAIVERATAINLDLADSIALERTRGFADLEPRLAWDQWQAARRPG